jgi:hypothetical protein
MSSDLGGCAGVCVFVCVCKTFLEWELNFPIVKFLWVFSLQETI